MEAQNLRDDSADTIEEFEVQNFLNRFSHALVNGRMQSLIDMWDIPALVVGDSMNMAITSVNEIQKFFTGAKDDYNARGINDTKAQIQDLYWATPNICVVEVRWPYLDKHNQEKGAERSIYVLKRQLGGAFKIAVAVLKGAEEQALLKV